MDIYLSPYTVIFNTSTYKGHPYIKQTLTHTHTYIHAHTPQVSVSMVSDLFNDRNTAYFSNPST